MSIRQSAWTGMVPVDDTALYVSDTGENCEPDGKAIASIRRSVLERSWVTGLASAHDECRSAGLMYEARCCLL
jgi:hypothetical protein